MWGNKKIREAAEVVVKKYFKKKRNFSLQKVVRGGKLGMTSGMRKELFL